MGRKDGGSHLVASPLCGRQGRSIQAGGQKRGLVLLGNKYDRRLHEPCAWSVLAEVHTHAPRYLLADIGKYFNKLSIATLCYYQVPTLQVVTFIPVAHIVAKPG